MASKRKGPRNGFKPRPAKMQGHSIQAVFVDELAGVPDIEIHQSHDLEKSLNHGFICFRCAKCICHDDDDLLEPCRS